MYGGESSILTMRTSMATLQMVLYLVAPNIAFGVPRDPRSGAGDQRPAVDIKNGPGGEIAPPAKSLSDNSHTTKIEPGLNATSEKKERDTLGELVFGDMLQWFSVNDTMDDQPRQIAAPPSHRSVSTLVDDKGHGSGGTVPPADHVGIMVVGHSSYRGDQRGAAVHRTRAGKQRQKHHGDGHVRAVNKRDIDFDFDYDAKWGSSGEKAGLSTLFKLPDKADTGVSDLPKKDKSDEGTSANNRGIKLRVEKWGVVTTTTPRPRSSRKRNKAKKATKGKGKLSSGNDWFSLKGFETNGWFDDWNVNSTDFAVSTTTVNPTQRDKPPHRDDTDHFMSVNGAEDSHFSIDDEWKHPFGAPEQGMHVGFLSMPNFFDVPEDGNVFSTMQHGVGRSSTSRSKESKSSDFFLRSSSADYSSFSVGPDQPARKPKKNSQSRKKKSRSGRRGGRKPNSAVPQQHVQAKATVTEPENSEPPPPDTDWSDFPAWLKSFEEIVSSGGWNMRRKREADVRTDANLNGTASMEQRIVRFLPHFLQWRHVSNL